MKKNSVFVKKLSSLTEQNRDKLVADLNSLNLTKYIEEVVNAICSAKLKVSLFANMFVSLFVIMFVYLFVCLFDCLQSRFLAAGRSQDFT